ncbi:MAG: hypothetical protein LBT12_04975, partial [Oscillospiraceae bacterium]|nr:hypothetical protein [Oscillospiraceae bacterium]
PPELEKTALQLTPYCALVFDAGGALTGITDDGTRPQETAEDPDYGEFLKGLYEEATNHE